MKMFEDHQRKEGMSLFRQVIRLPSRPVVLTQCLSPGKPVSHAFAKELIAGFAGGEVDKLCETKGADYIDREKAKRQARENAENLYDQQYGNNDQFDPREHRPHREMENQFGQW